MEEHMPMIVRGLAVSQLVPVRPVSHWPLSRRVAGGLIRHPATRGHKKISKDLCTYS